MLDPQITDPTQAKDWFEPALKALDLVLKGANIYLIFWIFRSNFVERRKERIRDGSREARKFVIQEVVLKPNMTAITDFIWNASEHVKTLPDKFKSPEMKVGDARTLAQTEIDHFKSKLDEITVKVIRPLGHLSPQFGTLPQHRQKLEDRYTEMIGNLAAQSAVDTVKALGEIDAAFGEFINAILGGQRAFLCAEEPSPVSSKRWRLWDPRTWFPNWRKRGKASA